MSASLCLDPPSIQSRAPPQSVEWLFSQNHERGTVAVNFLIKTEPSEYSFTDLQRDKQTVWDGITNAGALIHLRAMKPGDRLIVYETGTRRCAVGTAKVVSVNASNPKNPAVKISAGKALPVPVSLEQIKATPLFAGSALVRQGRLSVAPLTDPQYKFLLGE
jgi:predicted RNA-binding protein with PUA-like domain